MQIGLGGMAAEVTVISVCQSSRSISWSHIFFENAASGKFFIT
jgi:hypothetical protein